MASRRERKKEQTRAAVLNAAMVLFSERGISGTRVEDITQRADLGKGAFYNYFPSKDALVAELVAQGVQVFKSNYLGRLNGTPDLAERVSELVRLYSSFLDDNPHYALLIHQARGLVLLRAAKQDALREVFVDYLGGVGQALLATVDADTWSDQEVMDIAAALLGGVSGYRSFRKVAALPLQHSTAQEVMMLGIPGVVEQRQDIAPVV